MICEICGKEFRGKGIEVYVDGAQLMVCPGCAKFGTRVEPYKEKKKVLPRKSRGKGYVKRKRDTFTIVSDYAHVIRDAREERDLSQKDLAQKINEKESVIHRLETESMSPSHKLAKKLEKTLNIKLVDKISDFDVPKVISDSKNLTIGDIIKIKKK
jgi:putative transcription factor